MKITQMLVLMRYQFYVTMLVVNNFRKLQSGSFFIVHSIRLQKHWEQLSVYSIKSVPEHGFIDMGTFEV